MAEFSMYWSSLKEKEGGFVHHPHDNGGATNKGITLYTWSKYGYDIDRDGDIDIDDLKNISDKDAFNLYKRVYWDRIQGDKIHSQWLANTIFDHAVNAGPSRAAKKVQKILNDVFGQGLKIDGVIGPKTLDAINRVNIPLLYTHFNTMRKQYYSFLATYTHGITQDTQSFFRRSLHVAPHSKQKTFYRGWLNRLASFPKMVYTAVKKAIKKDEKKTTQTPIQTSIKITQQKANTLVKKKSPALKIIGAGVLLLFAYKLYD